MEAKIEAKMEANSRAIGKFDFNRHYKPTSCLVTGPEDDYFTAMALTTADDMIVAQTDRLFFLSNFEKKFGLWFPDTLIEDVAMNNGFIYMLDSKTQRILCLDPKSNNIRAIRIPPECDQASKFICDGNYIYVMGSKAIILMDMRSEEYRRLKLFANAEYKFAGMTLLGDRVVTIERSTSNIWFCSYCGPDTVISLDRATCPSSLILDQNQSLLVHDMGVLKAFERIENKWEYSRSVEEINRNFSVDLSGRIICQDSVSVSVYE